MSAFIVLSSIGSAFVLAVFAIFVKRRLFVRFPAFFGYCVWTLAVTVVRFVVANRATLYFIVYWVTEASYFLIALVVMAAILRPLAKIAGRDYLSSKCTLFLLVSAFVFCSLVAAFLKPINPTLPGHFASAVYVFVPLLCLLEAALLIWAIVIGHRAGIEWTRYEVGILVGFGMLALITLIARFPGILLLFHSPAGPELEGFFRYVPSGAFITSALTWLITFWRPEPTPPSEYRPTDPRKIQELTEQVKESGEVLKKIWKRLGLDCASAAPSIDDLLVH